MRHKSIHWVYILILLLIVGLAGGLRFYKLGTVPLGYAWDEAAIIYNSWSLSEWHRDENAVLLPLVFTSFGDHKPPFVFYWMAWQFYLTEMKPELLRINGALFGMGSILVMYLIAKEIGPRLIAFTADRHWSVLFKPDQLYSLMVVFLMAIMPWSIHLSRVGFEQIFAFFWVNLSIYFLMKAIKNPRYFVAGAITIALSVYTFHTARGFWVVALPLFCFLFRKQLFIPTEKPWRIAGVLLLGVLMLPFLYSVVTQGALARASSLILFGDGGEYRTFDLVLHEFFINIKNQSSLQFWINGYDAVSVRHMVPGHGVMHVLSFGLLMVGIVIGLVKRHQYYWFIVGWLIAGLAPALIANHTPHVIRSLFALSPVVLLASFGWIFGMYQLRLYFHKWVSVLFLGGTTVILLFELYNYTSYYFESYAKESAVAYQYGYKEVIDFLNTIQLNDTKVVMTDTLGQPYIYFLMYHQIPAQQYLWGGLSQYDFRSIDWPEMEKGKIYVGTADEIPPNDPQVIKVIFVPDSDIPVLVIARVE